MPPSKKSIFTPKVIQWEPYPVNKKQNTCQFYNFNENPIIGWGRHQLEEERSKGQVIFGIASSQLTNNIDCSRLHTWGKQMGKAQIPSMPSVEDSGAELPQQKQLKVQTCMSNGLASVPTLRQ